jgi:hypothetical protein
MGSPVSHVSRMEEARTPKRQRSSSPSSPTRVMRSRLDSNWQDGYDSDGQPRTNTSRRTLRERINREGNLILCLEPTPNQWSRRFTRPTICNYCLDNDIVDDEIKDDYRVAIPPEQRRPPSGLTTVQPNSLPTYAHVRCMEDTIQELASLAPCRFRLDVNPYPWNHRFPWNWSLMLRKWFEHSGQINLDKLAEYIRQYRRYQEATCHFGSAIDARQASHEQFCGASRKPEEDGEQMVLVPALSVENHGENNAALSCQCPPAPVAPRKPTLTDYYGTSATKSAPHVPLSAVLEHEMIEELRAKIVIVTVLETGHQERQVECPEYEIATGRQESRSEHRSTSTGSTGSIKL